MAYFRQTINLASVFFNNNTKRRTEYISDEMWYKFGRFSHFATFVLKDPSNWDFSFKSQHNVWGSVSKGADAIFPNYSYMFLQQSYSSNNNEVFINELGQHGSGMASTMISAIRNFIRLSQGQNETCNCIRMADQIRQLVNQYDRTQGWHVFCSSAPNLFSYVSVKDEKYMYTK